MSQFTGLHRDQGEGWLAPLKPADVPAGVLTVVPAAPQVHDTPKRIYYVARIDTDGARLMRAEHIRYVINALIADHYEIHVATPEELIALTKAGIDVEDPPKVGGM